MSSKLSIVRQLLATEPYLQRANLTDVNDVRAALNQLSAIAKEYGNHQDLRLRRRALINHGYILLCREMGIVHPSDFTERLLMADAATLHAIFNTPKL